MKILVVAHRFPPRHLGGAELYAWRLGRGLARRHEVTVFTADDALSQRNHSRRERMLDGMRVVEVTNHRRHDDFVQSYADPRMEELFVDVLRETRPDVVHFQHLMHSSVNLPLIAWELGVPSVATLHEYWLLCGRNGQMIRSDESRCERPGLSICAPCMSRFMWGRSGLDVWALRGLAGVRKMTGLDLGATARRLRLRGVERADDGLDEEEVADMRKNLLLREARVRDAFEGVAAWICPSEFLRDRFVAAGFDPEHLVVSRLGVETERFERRPPRPREGRLRVGFLGSIQRIKGVHVLLEALARLGPDLVEAEIWGDTSVKPDYVAELLAACSENVRLRGRVEPDAVPACFPDLDVLVVPSIWWENSPLVILEAFAAGLPVVCSDIGGMAELVEDEVSGLHFAVGDAEDLARKLRRLAEEPDLLARLARGVPEPRSIESDRRFHERLYATLATQRRDEDEDDFDDDGFGFDQA